MGISFIFSDHSMTQHSKVPHSIHRQCDAVDRSMCTCKSFAMTMKPSIVRWIDWNSAPHPIMSFPLKYLNNMLWTLHSQFQVGSSKLQKYIRNCNSIRHRYELNEKIYTIVCILDINRVVAMVCHVIIYIENVRFMEIWRYYIHIYSITFHLLFKPKCGNMCSLQFSWCDFLRQVRYKSAIWIEISYNKQTHYAN